MAKERETGCFESKLKFCKVLKQRRFQAASSNQVARSREDSADEGVGGTWRS
jgi:hypothetical protein